MSRDEIRHSRAIADAIEAWSNHAQLILNHRTAVTRDADSAEAHLRASVVTLIAGAQIGWRTILLGAGDLPGLAAIGRATASPALDETENGVLEQLAGEVKSAIAAARAVTGATRVFRSRSIREKGEAALRYLHDFHEWAAKWGLKEFLARIDDSARTPSISDVSMALDEHIGLRSRLADLGPARLLGREVFFTLSSSVATIERDLREVSGRRDSAIKCGEAVRRTETDRLVSEMPVERLRDATRERLRVGLLQSAGISTVQQVIQAGSRLWQVPGVGNTTAARMRGAAHMIWQATHDEMPVRIDVSHRSDATTDLLRALRAWDAARSTGLATKDLALKEGLAPLARSLDANISGILVTAASSSFDEFLRSLDALEDRAQTIKALGSSIATADPWDDFLARPADYFAMLSELGFLTEDEQKVHGDLPAEIIEAIREFELNTSNLTASLRGYQHFGARFALVQREVIIGDEMGLGKTVEALAAVAHLHAKGSRHTLVICPATVVTNWVRETKAKTTLDAYRLHGSDRATALRNWQRLGGVAVTTFETLAWLAQHISPSIELACVIVDEAQYIKNPQSLRGQRSALLIKKAERAILLTGTPLENRVEEFKNLVDYVRPGLTANVSDLRPRQFRIQVAPVYLRRNQEDVLLELPDLVEVNDWLPMSSQDDLAYRRAVASGNFHDMRQAAMLQGTDSEKVQRLVEIVEEAEQNGRRVIVFSHYRQVLDHVFRVLPGEVFGPLTGGVPPSQRQVMVDEFSRAGHGAVLVSQIQAGGVGLNIQAASIVVICEPQLKPTIEWQAIARAHRMGQLQSVQVHRLLTEVGVDVRVTEILARKSELFSEFARVSETAASAPEAFDISEAELVSEVLAAERQRLFPSGISLATERE